ncbi:MAG: hypothetical protein HYS26_02250 [Candidatus Kaiserbacteria bacterium]|nr:MAG: hypothetical protein HYS26_02250 [Candidatus Kaiserbacteria bacterium]
MSWSRQRNDLGRRLLRRLGLLALLGVVVFAISGVWGVFGKARDSQTLRAEAEVARNDLLSREAQLEADLEKLRTDRGVEEELRTQYSLAGEGERLIVIVDPSSTTPIKATSSPIKLWFQKIFPWW